MHLVPRDRRHHRVIDDERVCDAIAALGEPEIMERWAERFSLLGDRHRLTLLVCIAASGPISVTDLAVAADLEDARVSQLLRLLRSAGAVRAERDGRIVRYALADEALRSILPLRAASRGHRSA